MDINQKTNHQGLNIDHNSHCLTHGHAKTNPNNRLLDPSSEMLEHLARSR
jgi:hypothetical protein